VSDAFKPEADRLDQEREVGGARLPDDSPRASQPPMEYPQGRKMEVPDADRLEQEQPVEDDDDWR
jgi:hypothetical protein